MWASETLSLGPERSLRYAQGGAGPDLIALHGALTTHRDWLTGPAGALSASHRVTLVDRPGHGGSRRPRFAGTPRDQAAQIVDGMDRLGIERALVLAHSFGGMVAVALAERHAERVWGLVLVAPVAFPEARIIEHLMLAPRAFPIAGPILSWLAERSRFDRSLLEYVQREMFAPAPVPPHWRETYPWEEILDADAMVFEGEDAAAVLPFSPAATFDLSRIRVPVRVLAGSADRVVRPERQGEALAALLPNAASTRIEGAGHMLHHTHPEAVLAAVSDISA
jgi:pimeloyl-ACP methyl ester carboxylesterase